MTFLGCQSVDESACWVHGEVERAALVAKRVERDRDTIIGVPPATSRHLRPDDLITSETLLPEPLREHQGLAVDAERFGEEFSSQWLGPASSGKRLAVTCA